MSCRPCGVTKKRFLVSLQQSVMDWDGIRSSEYSVLNPYIILVDPLSIHPDDPHGDASVGSRCKIIAS